MKFPVALHTDNGTEFGVTVPDLSGCFSAGNSEDEALDNAREAILAHLELMAEDGEEIPIPESVSHHRKSPDFRDAIWGFADVDVAPFLGKAEKINITVPRLVLYQIDRYLKEHPEAGRSRSSFLTDAALQRVRAEGKPRQD